MDVQSKITRSVPSTTIAIKSNGKCITEAKNTPRARSRVLSSTSLPAMTKNATHDTAAIIA